MNVIIKETISCIEKLACDHCPIIFPLIKTNETFQPTSAMISKSHKMTFGRNECRRNPYMFYSFLISLIKVQSMHALLYVAMCYILTV